MQKKALMFLTAAIVCSAMASDAATISKRRIAHDGDERRNILFVTVGGREKAIAKEVGNSWLIEGGKALVYSGVDGARVHHDNAQSLWRYDAGSGRIKKLLVSTDGIDRVRERRATSGKIALVVELSGYHSEPGLAVVHPRRGQVWQMDWARLIGVKNGRLAVGVLDPDKIKRPRDIATAKPSRMIYPDLDQLLRRKTMKLQTRKD